MKKIERVISLLIAVAIVMSIAVYSTVAYGAGWASSVTPIEFNTTYNESASVTDTQAPGEERFFTYHDAFKFTVPAKGTVTLKIESEAYDYCARAHYNCHNIDFNIYRENDLENSIWDGRDNCTKYGTNSATGMYYSYSTANLAPGTYYLAMHYYDYFTENDSAAALGYDFTLEYSPIISNVSSLSASSRGTGSIRLNWSSVSNVNGYLFQCYDGSTRINDVYTNSTNYTISGLSSATVYKFRVCAYKYVNGKRYYSSKWTVLTTPTRPGKVTIVTPTTSTSHKITAKWKKCARVSGYQVQFCSNKSCSNVISSKLVSGQTKTSYTKSKLKKGKRYYIRVRAYKTYNNGRYYGSWSSVKSIRCK